MKNVVLMVGIAPFTRIAYQIVHMKQQAKEMVYAMQI